MSDKIALWEFASAYKFYSDHKAKGHDYYLSSIFSQQERMVFEKAYMHASKNKDIDKAIRDLIVERDDFFSKPQFLAANPHATKISPIDTSLKALDNISSGIMGTLFQALGQHLHPNDPQKAAAFGGFGKILGDLGSGLAKWKAEQDKADNMGKKIIGDPLKAPPSKPSDSLAGSKLDSFLKSLEGKPAQKTPDAKPDGSNKFDLDNNSTDSF